MTDTILIRSPIALKEFIRSVAAQKGISVNAQILSILWDYRKCFEEHEKPYTAGKK